MFAFDWNDLQPFHYIAIGGGVVLLLTLLLYLILGDARQKLKIPTIILAHPRYLPSSRSSRV